MTQLDSEGLLSDSEMYLKNVAIDNVILGYHDRELKVLLQQPIPFDKWTVTGGYIKRTESVEESAQRIAYSRTELKNIFLQQFHFFGSAQRGLDSIKYHKQINNSAQIQIPKDHWLFDRFISLGFYTLTEFSKVNVQKGEFDQDCQWWPINELPQMMFDHKLIIEEALRALRLHMVHFPIGYELLPEKFTLPEIQNLYETILGKALDNRNFTKKLMKNGILIRLKETKKIGAHRSPWLYKFDKERYDDYLNTGVDLLF
jgi:8-oxo-dGTP diphosphatase